MSVERKILTAVARIDLMIVRTAQVTALFIIVALFLALVWGVRTLIEMRFDPYRIDYDAPGVDITSEGPEDGDPWYEEGGE